MLSAASEPFSRNLFRSLVTDTSSTVNPQQGTENREPLPNPWSASQPNTGATTTPNIGNRPGPFNNASMASLMQQMAENPQLVQNMLSAPYAQSIMQALAADPNIANSVIVDNPLFQGNPQLQEQMRALMPQLLQQMQNPEMQNLMSNPQALNAIMQIQQGMETLRSTAPNLINTFEMGNLIPPRTAPSTDTSTATTTTTTSPAPSNESGTTPTATPRPQQTNQRDAFSEVCN